MEKGGNWKGKLEREVMSWLSFGFYRFVVLIFYFFGMEVFENFRGVFYFRVRRYVYKELFLV